MLLQYMHVYDVFGGISHFLTDVGIQYVQRKLHIWRSQVGSKAARMYNFLSRIW